ncbi:hypothetical protein C3E80_11175 [Cronobacter malonaticus]|uniref:Uncharacterized protein n=1 Tax=Cronobacter malonaticus TaxID=413503 RepID=A0A423XW68_9ENTR|nr:hypothetical protein C3E80_11175 [Cronobacter malonaticus]RRA40716.1 hypothetical protein C4882_11665 [Cronobacter malonaticus]
MVDALRLSPSTSNFIVGRVSSRTRQFPGQTQPITLRLHPLAARVTEHRAAHLHAMFISVTYLQ